MDDDAVRPIVLDATVLSNFASSSTAEELVRILDHPATVPAVRDELERGRDLHYRFLDEALAHVGTISLCCRSVTKRSIYVPRLGSVSILGKRSHFSRQSSTMERSQRMIWLHVGWL